MKEKNLPEIRAEIKRPQPTDDRILTLRLQSDGSFILTGSQEVIHQFMEEMKGRGIEAGECHFTLCG